MSNDFSYLKNEDKFEMYMFHLCLYSILLTIYFIGSILLIIFNFPYLLIFTVPLIIWKSYLLSKTKNKILKLYLEKKI